MCWSTDSRIIKSPRKPCWTKAKFASEENPLFYRPERKSYVKWWSVTKVLYLTLLFVPWNYVCLPCFRSSAKFLGPEGTFTQSAVLKHFGQLFVHYQLLMKCSVRWKRTLRCSSSWKLIWRYCEPYCFKTSNLNVIGEVELRINSWSLKIHVKTALNRFMLNFGPMSSVVRRALSGCWTLNSNAEAARRIRNEWHSLHLILQQVCITLKFCIAI